MHVHLIYISIKSKMLYMLVEINRSEIRQNEKFRSKARSTSVQKYLHVVSLNLAAISQKQ